MAGPVGPDPVAIMAHSSGETINLILNALNASEDNILVEVPEKHTGCTHMALGVGDMNAVQGALEEWGGALSGGPVSLPADP